MRCGLPFSSAVASRATRILSTKPISASVSVVRFGIAHPSVKMLPACDRYFLNRRDNHVGQHIEWLQFMYIPQAEDGLVDAHFCLGREHVYGLRWAERVIPAVARQDEVIEGGFLNV